VIRIAEEQVVHPVTHPPPPPSSGVCYHHPGV
jgi:hypothetical protein